MEPSKESLALIDLISETHAKMRRIAEDRWVQEGNEEVSHSEMHLLAKSRYQNLSIAEASRILGISRQAAHKTSLKLRERGYLDLKNPAGNRRDKHIVLTAKGRGFCKRYDRIKRAVEDCIRQRIGDENVQTLRSLLEDLHGAQV
ncbi:MarR family winged helix-turn-helix transcriptional regulator [Pelagicoccus albus]|uniref:MarR family transcriptional regulator n=1 Tax=Pelagicoccus albus TaxID=415222 RepID=A0A7X1E956_9BACT|nr:MarR family transcriptional regulator [Pelagicoccus albus]MBC2607475.1 MarR family transcriptional regulator [Pelagicoccus albus]